MVASAAAAISAADTASIAPDMSWLNRSEARAKVEQ